MDNAINTYESSMLRTVGNTIGNGLISYYKSLPVEEQQPFYLDNDRKRWRVHHGLAGLVLSFVCAVGVQSQDETIRALSYVGLGIGEALVKDDINDIENWLSDLFR